MNRRTSFRKHFKILLRWLHSTRTAYSSFSLSWGFVTRCLNNYFNKIFCMLFKRVPMLTFDILFYFHLGKYIRLMYCNVFWRATNDAIAFFWWNLVFHMDDAFEMSSFWISFSSCKERCCISALIPFAIDLMNILVISYSLDNGHYQFNETAW